MRQILLVLAVIGLCLYTKIAADAAIFVVIGGYHVPVLPGTDGKSVDFLKETNEYTLMFSFSMCTLSPPLTKAGLTEATLEDMRILKMKRAKAGTPIVAMHSHP